MPGPLTLGQIVSRLGGRVAGDPGILTVAVGPLQGAGPGQISFYASRKYRAQLAATRAAAVIVAPDDEKACKLARIVTERPYAYCARLSQLFNPVMTQSPGVHPPAIVAKTAVLGKNVSIGAGCVVGDGASIGDDSCLYPRVVVYAGCFIGKRNIVHAGAVIGADGFGFADDGGQWVKIPQVGGVRIGDDVEIGANTTIDRGALEDTVIEEGVKLDNQIQVGHNVRIGSHTAIAGCAGIAGSADIGRHCTIGGAAVILGQLRIVDRVHVSARTLISRSILKPGTYTGVYPFDENKAWARAAATRRRKGKTNERNG